jgi:hypothetical protein
MVLRQLSVADCHIGLKIGDSSVWEAVRMRDPLSLFVHVLIIVLLLMRRGGVRSLITKSVPDLDFDRPIALLSFLLVWAPNLLSVFAIPHKRPVEFC